MRINQLILSLVAAAGIVVAGLIGWQRKGVEKRGQSHLLSAGETAFDQGAHGARPMKSP